MCNATKIVNMENKHYQKVKGLKDRLYACGSDVSDDEDPPDIVNPKDLGGRGSRAKHLDRSSSMDTPRFIRATLRLQ